MPTTISVTDEEKRAVIKGRAAIGERSGIAIPFGQAAAISSLLLRDFLLKQWTGTEKAEDELRLALKKGDLEEILKLIKTYTNR